jgi:ubiquinone/menaquinone biosynthesis C-methylase UbiE
MENNKKTITDEENMSTDKDNKNYGALHKFLRRYDESLSNSVTVSNFGHSIGIENSINLIKKLQIKKGECIWEIGCGLPVLAFHLLAACKFCVVITELGIYLNLFLPFVV